MRAQFAVLVLLTAPALTGGCLRFGELRSSSRCAAADAQVAWVNAPAPRRPAAVPASNLDEALNDPAFSAAAAASGPARFRFDASGPHLVEVFLWTPDDGKHSFVLRQDGKAIDEPHQYLKGAIRLRPKVNLRLASLVGIAEGGREITVDTTSPEWSLAAIRWTPRGEFERMLAPAWLKRGRDWLNSPRFGEGASGRQRFIEQLFGRLIFSSQPEVRKEALLGLTRALYWVTAENHEPRDIARTDVLFREGLKTMPGDPLLRQMITSSCRGLNGPAARMPHGEYCETVQPVSWDVDSPAPPAGAPAWAVEQMKLRARMEAITRWWVEKRMQPNGELGGGWGDDVEILRQWGPLALGLGSEVAERGVRRLAEGLWNSGTLAHGYDRRVSDVEHSSEPTTDTQPLAAAVDPDSAAVRKRLAETAACADTWIARQPDGRWRFRSSWFNCREMDVKPGRDVDVHLNTRAMGPFLWHAYLTRDPHAIDLLRNWATSWVDAMRSTAHGKPAGIFPSVLRAADGAYRIGSGTWDKPEAEWDYFQWSGGSQEALASLALALHDLTGDRAWLDAAGESFQILGNCGAHAALCEEIRQTPQAFYEWRRRSGESRYDAAFGYRPDPPASEVLAALERQARELSARIGVNFEMFTSEVMYTDRVYYALPAETKLYLFGGEAPRGDRLPGFAITWPAVKERFARAVVRASADALELRAYNFESTPATAPVRVWRLRPGRYRVEVSGVDGARLRWSNVNVTQAPQTVEIALPPAREVVVTIRKS